MSLYSLLLLIDNALDSLVFSYQILCLTNLFLYCYKGLAEYKKMADPCTL